MSYNTSGEQIIKYLDVYADLKEAILNGKYLKGSFLPTEKKLTDTYGVSRTTVRKAVSMLQQEGLVSVQQGRGTEVTSGKSQLRPAGFEKYKNVTGVKSRFTRPGEAVGMSSVVDAVQASASVANVFGVEPGTEVWRVQRLKSQGGEPFSYVVSYIPKNLAPDLQRWSGRVFYLYTLLKQQYGVVSTQVEETLTAESAKFVEANLLLVPVDAPLLVTRRVAWAGEQVMEYCETYFRPDIYRVSITMQGDIDYVAPDGESIY